MLTIEQKQLVVNILIEKITSMKKHTGTEFSQHKLSEIVKILHNDVTGDSNGNKRSQEED